MSTVHHILRMLIQRRQLKELLVAGRTLVHPPFAPVQSTKYILSTLVAPVRQGVDLALCHLRRTRAGLEVDEHTRERLEGVVAAVAAHCAGLVFLLVLSISVNVDSADRCTSR
jgi:hypothetical protein